MIAATDRPFSNAYTSERELSMSCKVCNGRQAQFAAEVCIHFSGIRRLDHPSVFEFPTLLVCMECGFSVFNVSQADLAVLAKSQQSFPPSPKGSSAEAG